jgi:hypothetical protein
MSKTLAAIRAKYPQYAHVPDEDLAVRVASKYPIYRQRDAELDAIVKAWVPPSMRPIAPGGEDSLAPAPPEPVAWPTESDELTRLRQLREFYGTPEGQAKLDAASRAFGEVTGASVVGPVLHRAAKLTEAAARDVVGDMAAGLVARDDQEWQALRERNMQAFARDPEAELPGRAASREYLSRGQRVAENVGLLGATLPVMAGQVAGATMLGVPAPLALAAMMGTTEVGEVDPVGAVMGLGLPGATQMGKQAVAAGLEKAGIDRVVVEVVSRDPLRLKGKVVQRLGGIEISNDAFRKVLENGGGLLAANTYMNALSAPQVLALPEEERTEAAMNMVANNLAMSVAGLFEQRPTSITLENLMPKLRQQWREANTPPYRARMGQSGPAEEGAPVRPGPYPALPERGVGRMPSEPPPASPSNLPTSPERPAPAVPAGAPTSLSPEATVPPASSAGGTPTAAPAGTKAAGELPPAANADAGEAVANMVARRLRLGETVTPAQVRDEGLSFGLDERQSGEWAELGAAEVAREIAQDATMSNRDKFAALVSLYNRMPAHGTRTVETKAMQQYSTPPPLAFVGGVLADLPGGGVVADSTAGHGMLTISASPSAYLVLNELSGERHQRLRRFLRGRAGESPGLDALSGDFWRLLSERRPDRVALNPPFGSVLDPATGAPKKFPILNAATEAKTTTSIDLAIALNTLEAMTPNGKGFAIIGAKTGTPYGGTFGTDQARAEEYRRAAMLEFFERFNVVDWFTIGGDLYRKMGAAWPVDMIVVHGKGKTPSAQAGGLVRPWVKPPRVIETWEQLGQLIEQYETRTSPGKAGGGAGGTRSSPPAGAGATTGPREPGVSPARPERPPQGSRPGGGTATPAPAPSPNPTPAPPAQRPGDSGAGIGKGTPEPAGSVAPGGTPGGKPAAPPVGGTGAVAAGSGQDNAGKSELDQVKGLWQQLAALNGDAGQFEAAIKAAEGGYPVNLKDLARQIRDAIAQAQKVRSGTTATPKPPQVGTPSPKPSVPVEGLPASLMVPYQSVSKGPSLNLVAPRNIANQMQAAARQLEQEVGMPIDEYLAAKLGRDVKTLHSQLAGAQVDTAALAIRNIERGSALICAHETGVGKGRVVAALIEYARMRNLMPVFITAKPNLYEDMLARDLPALGNKEFKPFITNTNYAYEDAHGREVKSSGNAAARVAEMESVVRTGNLPGGAQGIFTTYDQLKSDKPAGWSETAKEKFARKGGREGKNAKARPDGPRFAMLRAIAPRAIFILDEAHLAAGPGSEVNLSLSTILPQAKGVYYSSATFAKRPDNLGLYALGTLMKRTGLNSAQMTEALQKGGVPLQQALTSMLAESGELIRVQQDWAGVEMRFESTAANPAAMAREVEAADTYTSFIRDLITLNKLINQAGKALEDGENQVRADEQQVKLQDINPMARLFNLSNQYLFALRADAVADKAVAELKAGRKPFIHVHNTLEGPLLDLRARKLPMNFQGILLREMQKMLVLTLRDPKVEGGKRQVELKPEDLPDGGKFYRQLERQILAADLSQFSISPIDHIKKKIQAAGYSIGEITARDGEVDDAGGEVKIAKREKASRNKILKAYNDGELDVLLINGSGGTGLSAHTDPKFKDQRQRVYIEGQPAPDINDEMQAMGRTMRSGQTSKPKYIFLSTALAAERRFATMLRGKMTSLNANTTAEGESGLTQQEGFAEDIFNQVGDDVVFRVMQANPVEAALMDLAMEADDADLTAGFARYATGRFVLLPNADAQRLWDEIIAEYQDEITRLNEEGQNPLRATAEDLRAQTIETTELTAATGNTLFDGAAVLEKTMIRPPKAPPTHDEAVQRARDNIPATKQRVREWLEKSKAAEAERVAAAQARGQTGQQVERIKANMQAVREAVIEAFRKQGDTFGVDKLGDGSNSFYGVAAELRLAEKQASDFSSLSRQELILTANTFAGRYRIPLSKLFKNGEEQPLLNLLDEDAAAEQFNTTAESSAERYIVTGNLLRGWEAADQATAGREMGRPRVAIYTRHDGSLNTGVLMPPGWTPGAATEPVQVITDAFEFAAAVQAQTPLRSLPTSAVHPVEVRDGRLLVPSSGQGKLLWGDPQFSEFFVRPPQQIQGNFVGVIGVDPARLFEFLKAKGVRLVNNPSESAAMRGPGGGGGGGVAARGAFVSGASKAPGSVPPTVNFGGMNLVRPLELPELVRIARELAGAVPKIRKFPQRGGKQTLGHFGDGIITLDPRIFKDAETAAKVLAHELGHLVDYLPHETLKRGNLLGHLLALRGFLRHNFGPLNNKVLRDELLALTMWWRPYDPVNDSPTYVKYRQSPEELYADALSVLFNAPNELETRAPAFYKAFWEKLGNRPEVETALFAIQELLNKGKLETATDREARLLAGFAEGEARWKSAVQARAQAARSWEGWWTRLGQEFYWQFFPLEQRANRLEKAGVKLPLEKDPRVFLDDLGFSDVAVMRWGRTIHEKVVQPIESAGLTLVDAGKMLFYERILEGDRAGLANPGGMTPEAARLGLLKMNLELGLGKMTLLRAALDRFHAEVFKLAEVAVAVGAYNRSTFERVIRPNKGTYATFAVLDYVDDWMPPGIKEQVGTLKDVANPFQATILKSIGLIHLIAQQRAKNKTVEFLTTFFPGDLARAPGDGTPAARKGKGVFMRLENGKPVYYYTDPYIAEAFDKGNPRTLWPIVKAADGVFRKFVYPLIITYNPAFLYIMSPLRDMQRTARNLPGLRFSVGGLPVEQARNLRQTGQRYTGQHTYTTPSGRTYTGQGSPLIREMEAMLALGTPFDQFIRGNRDDFMADLLRRMRVLPDGEVEGWFENVVWLPLRTALDKLELGGLTLDALAKTSAYSMLRKQGRSSREAGVWVRNNAGLPNINKKGLLVKQVRALVPFWNVFVQAWRADLKLMTHPTTRAGWWFRYFASNGLARVLLAVGATGALGAALKELFDGIGEYDKTNYLSVPVGATDGADFGRKTVYLRIPESETDRMIGALISKAIRSLGPQDVALTDILDFGMGQIPSVNPVVSVPLKWSEYLRGQNPRDTFRGREIVPPREWQAGGLHSVEPMALWAVEQTGLMNFFRWDPRSETTWQLTLSATPGLNKFLKMSDQGYREQQRAVQDEQVAAAAAEKLRLPKPVQSIEAEYWRLARLGEQRTPEQQRRYVDLHAWYRTIYAPAWESIQQATEEQRGETAQRLRDALDRDSRSYYRR